MTRNCAQIFHTVNVYSLRMTEFTLGLGNNKLQHFLNAFYTKKRLSPGLLTDIEPPKEMFHTMLDMKNANKKQDKKFKIAIKIERPILVFLSP